MQLWLQFGNSNVPDLPFLQFSPACIPFTMNRIRDNSFAKHKTRATTSLLACKQAAHSCETSNYSSIFLLTFVDEMCKHSMAEERKNLILSMQFRLQNLSEKESLQRFRFKKQHIQTLVSVLTFLDSSTITSRRWYSTTVVESLCIVLRRLSTSTRWSDSKYEFGRHEAALCEIFYETMDILYTHNQHRVTCFQSLLMRNRREIYANAINDAGSPLEKCLGFIDGTVLAIARPTGSMQRATYNGHKRKNDIKFQCVTFPDGLFSHVNGPVEGRRHDITLYRESNLDSYLQTSTSVDGEQYYIYGDPAYLIRLYLQVGFKGHSLTTDQKEFNLQMSRVRVSVEWAFAEVKQYWGHLDHSRKLKTGCTPVGSSYIVAIIFWNFRVCFYGSQTATFFNFHPTTLNEYIELTQQTND